MFWSQNWFTLFYIFFSVYNIIGDVQQWLRCMSGPVVCWVCFLQGAHSQLHNVFAMFTTFAEQNHTENHKDSWIHPVMILHRIWHQEPNKLKKHLERHPANTTCVISGKCFKSICCWSLNSLQEIKKWDFILVDQIMCCQLAIKWSWNCLLCLSKHFLRKHQKAWIEFDMLAYQWRKKLICLLSS